MAQQLYTHDDVIKWKHFPHYWPFVQGIHWWLVIGELPSQRPVKRSFDVFFDLRLNKRANKQSRFQGFETPSRSSWRHCNACQFFLPNRLVARILQCISPTSHNAPLCNRNVHTCAYFCYKVVHSGIFVRCIIGFTKCICTDNRHPKPWCVFVQL